MQPGDFNCLGSLSSHMMELRYTIYLFQRSPSGFLLVLHSYASPILSSLLFNYTYIYHKLAHNYRFHGADHFLYVLLTSIQKLLLPCTMQDNRLRKPVYHETKLFHSTACRQGGLDGILKSRDFPGVKEPTSNSMGGGTLPTLTPDRKLL